MFDKCKIEVRRVSTMDDVEGAFNMTFRIYYGVNMLCCDMERKMFVEAKNN